MIYLDENKLKKLQGVLLELLKEFDRICRKHNIIYSVDGGTLLGAVRHKGFIPWDDDADVIMNRSQYERFISVLDMELDRERFYFQDINRTKGYRWGYGKLRRKDSLFLREGQEHMPYSQGIFLDIFVCDFVPEFYPMRCICNFNSFVLRKAFYSPVGMQNTKGISHIIYSLLSRIPEHVLKREYRRYIYHRNRRESSMVKCITYQAKNAVFGYKRKWYEEVIEMEFSGYSFLASKDYKEYLEFMYGNYMEIPGEADRQTHPVSRLKFPGEREVTE